MLSETTNYEKAMFDRGIKYIAGIDEVGRGPLAGPLVVGAVILDLKKVLGLLNDISKINDIKDHPGIFYDQINDSKKLTDLRRRSLNKFVRSEAISYSIHEISHFEVDEWGISKSIQEAFYEVIEKLNPKPEHIFTDTYEIKKITEEHQSNIIRGDSKSINVAAASIIAKVYRDDIMIKMHDKYPAYGFDKHKGYGTKAHMEALDKHGPCEIHRKSFRPVGIFFEN